MKRLIAIAVICMGALGLAPGSAPAAPAAPAWSVTGLTYPTNFEAGSQGEIQRGPGYTIIATNVGGSATTGEYTITDTLPAGLSPTGEVGGADRNVKEMGLSCETSGQVVSCGADHPIPPGEFFTLDVAVDVEAGAGGRLENRLSIEGGGAPISTASVPTQIGGATPPFSILDGASSFSGFLEDGSASTQAGSHPNQLAISMSFPTERGKTSEARVEADGHLRDVIVDLPRGFVVNPTATPVLCKESQLETTSCPLASQIGTVAVRSLAYGGPFAEASALYNMVPPAGAPAELAFSALNVGVFVHLLGNVRSDGEYQLSAVSNDILARGLNPVLGVQAILWGNPSAESHDSDRGQFCLRGKESSCPVERREAAFLTEPSACSAAPSATYSADSYEAPGVFSTTEVPITDGQGNPVGIRGCSLLDFSPTITLNPATEVSDSPTGLDVHLHVPQDQTYTSLAEANLEDAKVTLPGGIAVNPSSANGLGACSPAQIGLTTPVGQSPIHFSDEPAACPDDSKLGTVEVDTPLLDHPLPGSIYLASPHQNPFGSLLAIYVAVYDPQTGVVIKLAGKVDADPVTGRLITTFDENPELPFEDFHLDFFGGARAALRTPATCGTFVTQSELTPWSGTAPVDGSDPFTISRSPTGGICPTTSAERPNSPSFEAGTLTPLAGTYSPFVLRLRRQDGTQEPRIINAKLPLGLLGRLAGVPYCPDAQIAAAAERAGRDEEASPSCPPASQVGTVKVGAGAGPQPYFVTGKAYLAGPYKGAPLSLAIITPAVAGPYDLGTVVVRSALHVDPETAEITVKSDPIPTILEGIPLDVRSIAVEMDRPEFTLNPTSCDAMAVAGEEVSVEGQVARLSNRFQVGGCKGLDFKPGLQVRLNGATKRIGHPALKAVLTAKPGEANISRAQVNLPHGEFLDQGNLNKTCTRPVLLAGNCPKSTVYGRAKAWTPLLEKPLQGPVYLVGGYGYKLPALVAELNGQIRILLVGKVDSGKNKGIRSTFESVPDAPVSRFVLEMKGGKKYGLLENSENLCRASKAKRRAIVRFTGQNGKVDQYKPVVANQCGKAKKKTHANHQGAERKKKD